MKPRVLSGMRPTGSLHLGHLCGVLSNWLRMQDEMECFFFVADWHALTTDYADPADYTANTREMLISWLAAGIDENSAVLFVQSQVPEHAELHLLLSMLCPLSKLTQLPTYKEQKENLNRNLDTYGFLGYPLLQSADILAYRPHYVPVGEDQLPHIEFTREIARRFNYLYGKSDDFTDFIQQLLQQLSVAGRDAIERAGQRYRQDGDEAALADAFAVIDQSALSQENKATLRSYCRYNTREILPIPESRLAPTAKLPGLDGRKMSKSYDNTIDLFDNDELIAQKISRMQTDPARQRRQDKGDPDKCPVWDLHKYFSDEPTHQWVREGCCSAAIGCVDCKKRLTQHLQAALQPLHDRRRDIEKSGAVDDIIAAGNHRAREVAAQTLAEVRQAMRLAPPQ